MTDHHHANLQSPRHQPGTHPPTTLLLSISQVTMSRKPSYPATPCTLTERDVGEPGIRRAARRGAEEDNNAEGGEPFGGGDAGGDATYSSAGEHELVVMPLMPKV
ncbi:hypothetical protein ACRE_088740 [Hapsidospora chrysogenum ATCC 11550]|uniref:Uncharacterized protein n=1 Tax=Hapsidospora chrysogenum (strain ATCC 11550 / CBS 779.69 / DSM 880 / IAM 14645 / JCM 23072 / IMI 49137) TaxID=857340 RepID=A0A086STM8_HAPC1|nr:hypothetical protein ACRE_088740 [Hapsidospora chrysogenum ATCC 11550]